MQKLERKKIIAVIENYDRFIRDGKHLDNLANLFAEKVYWHVFSSGTGAWNEKHASTRDEVKQLYAYFHNNIQTLNVTYTDFIIDELNHRLALLVLAKGKNADGTCYDMTNSVHLELDENYQITRFLNWYGITPSLAWP